jgi:hypothetical protein
MPLLDFLEEEDNFEDLGKDGMILEWMLKE